MRATNMLLTIALILLFLTFIIIIFIVTAPPTTYEVEAKVLYYISDKVYCEDTNGNIWAFTTEGYTLQEGERIVLEIYAGDMDYIQDDKVLEVKHIIE